jgi:hypothetical protein
VAPAGRLDGNCPCRPRAPFAAAWWWMKILVTGNVQLEDSSDGHIRW